MVRLIIERKKVAVSKGAKCNRIIIFIKVYNLIIYKLVIKIINAKRLFRQPLL